MQGSLFYILVGHEGPTRVQRHVVAENNISLFDFVTDQGPSIKGWQAGFSLRATIGEPLIYGNGVYLA